MEPRSTAGVRLVLAVAGVGVLLAGVGWYLALSARKQLETCRAKGRAAAVEHARRARCPKRELRIFPVFPRTVSARPAARIRPKARPAPVRRALSPSAKIRALLEDPEVKRHIEERAQAIAKDRVARQLADHKDAEKKKQALRFHKYLDTLERGVRNAVAVYAEKNDLPRNVETRLRDIIDNGFRKGRKVFEQYQAGELTEEEAKEEGAAARKEDAMAIAKLLGEDAAKAFGETVRAEARKAFEKPAE